MLLTPFLCTLLISMDTIDGKVLIFTDCHLGLRQNSLSRLNIVVKVFKQIVEYIKANQIGTVIFVGDAFHDRRSLDINTLNVGLKLFNAVAKYAKVYLIVGNHDMHYKTTTDITSINIFKDSKNIVVISKPTEVKINNVDSLLVPWAANLSTFTKNKYDLLFGHFDISEKFLIASYIEEHSSEKEDEESLLTQLIETDSFLNDSMTYSTENINSNISTVINEKLQSEDLIGNFIDLAKPGATIYSGHIHENKEFVAKGRNIIFVGSPYQQNFGEMLSRNGFYILDESLNKTFVDIIAPKHVKLKMSTIINEGVDNFDFSIIKGNILKKIYDVEIDRITESKINQKIIDYQPYEEVLSEYNVQPFSSNDGKVDNETLSLIKKSKLEYIKNYISNMDSNLLTEAAIDKTKLYNILEEYYNRAVEESKI